MTDGCAKRVVDEFLNNLRWLKSSPKILIDLTIEEEVDRLREHQVDLVIGDVLISDLSRMMYYENSGIKSLSPHSLGYSSFRISFSQVLYLGEMILKRLNRPLRETDLLYMRYRYHPERFPTMLSEISDEYIWERIMKKVWRGRS